MLSALLLKFILLSCSCFLFFAVHRLYRCVDAVIGVEKKLNLRFTGGMLPPVVSKMISFDGIGMPCLVRLQATISDPV